MKPYVVVNLDHPTILHMFVDFANATAWANARNEQMGKVTLVAVTYGTAMDIREAYVSALKAQGVKVES